MIFTPLLAGLATGAATVSRTAAALLQDTPDAGGAAGASPTGTGGGLFGGNMLIPMTLIFGIFYFLLIVPERKKQKARDAMLEALSKGDKVITTGGLYGSVTQVKDQVVTLEIADGVRVRYAMGSIQQVVEEKHAGTK